MRREKISQVQRVPSAWTNLSTWLLGQLTFSSLAAEIFLVLFASLLPLSQVHSSFSLPVHLQGPVSEPAFLAIFHSFQIQWCSGRKKSVIFYLRISHSAKILCCAQLLFQTTCQQRWCSNNNYGQHRTEHLLNVSWFSSSCLRWARHKYVELCTCMHLYKSGVLNLTSIHSEHGQFTPEICLPAY